MSLISYIRIFVDGFFVGRLLGRGLISLSLLRSPMSSLELLLC